MSQPDKAKNCSKKWVFFRKRDILWVVALLFLAAGLLFAFSLTRTEGAVAVVTIGYGDAQQVQRIPLSEDKLIEIDAKLPVQLEVKDGAIRFVRSLCPDHLCEEFGWLRHEGDWAACLPAGVTMRVEESSSQLTAE